MSLHPSLKSCRFESIRKRKQSPGQKYGSERKRRIQEEKRKVLANMSFEEIMEKRRRDLLEVEKIIEEQNKPHPRSQFAKKQRRVYNCD